MRIAFTISVALLAIGLLGCGSDHPNAVERAEYRYWASNNHHSPDQTADCDQVAEITLSGRTYRAYSCTIHGGTAQTGDGVDFAAYWNGKKALSCPELPRAAQNRLCFD